MNDGEYPSDYGWDTTGLGDDPTTLERYRVAELIHARWAMLGTLGCLTPDITAKSSDVQTGEPVRSKAGTHILQEGGLRCFGNPWEPSLTRAKSILAILACQVLLMSAVEACCDGQAGPAGEDLDMPRPDEASDTLGLAGDRDTFAELNVKEVKNGRLAMLSMR